MLTCAHNTPFGDINDSEDDLQPLVFSMFSGASRALRLLAGAMATVEVDRLRMARRAREGFLTVTELADTLVRHEGLSFRDAHDLVAEAVRACGADEDPAAIASALRRVRPGLGLSDAEILRALDPEHFIRIRNIAGGPAPEQTSGALALAREGQRRMEAWIKDKTAQLDAARASLAPPPANRK